MHPYLTPLSTYTLFVSPSFSHTSALWYMYGLLMNRPSCQSILVSFRICIYLVQFTQSNTFCQSMQQASNSSSKSKVHSGIFLSILCPSFPFLFFIINVGAEIGQLSRSHTQHNVQEDYCVKMRGYMRYNRGLTLEAIHSRYTFLQCANVINCNKKKNNWIPMQVCIHYIFKSLAVFSAIYYLSYI